MLSTIERVLTLQKNEIFAEVSTEGLAHLAAIAEEVEFDAGDSLFHEGEIPDACYLILAGHVELNRSNQTELTVGPGDDIGVWALFDGEPRVFAARATENTHALKITQEDFYDLLADHTDIVQSFFRTLVRRIRRVLTDRTGQTTNPTG
ncbi:MAG: cyclic nucleotide-binding domain-containing protein [candidate division Zixibacteria bacterium]|nr:cyclic nucleotide-binding domain-containing protein [candidate division Zixibacteria bacterium]